MKKLILPLTLILLVGLSGLVIASMTRSGNGPYEVTIDLNEGWNIIAGTIPNDGILSGSEIQPEDISAVWYYSPYQKKYLEVHPNLDQNAINDDDDDFVLTTAMWIYVKKAGTIKYSTLEDYPSLENRQLIKGWNFVTLTPDFIDALVDKKVGACTIEASYFWDLGNKKWLRFPFYNVQQFTWDGDSVLGHGLVIKVPEDCTLGPAGSSGSTGVTPPPLPLETQLPKGETSICEDTDGYDIYTDGKVSYGYGNSDALTGASGDYCDHYAKGAEFRVGLIREGYCDGVTYMQDLVSCGDGFVCRAGRCIEGDSSLSMCSDTDGGKDEFVVGEIVGIGGSGDDECWYSNNNENPELDGGFTPDCSGDNCYMYEHYCDGETKAHEIIKCSNGCSGRVCL